MGALKGVLLSATLVIIVFSTILQLQAQSSAPLVCVYYYPWYSSSGRHWNASVDKTWSVLDKPILGYYDSRDEALLRKHLFMLRNLSVDCLFISWWGPGSYEDYAARALFKLLPEYGLRAAILVEPYLGNISSLYNRSWWNRILAYLRENYIERYPDVYIYLNGKPLVLAFNPIGMLYSSAMISRDFPGYTVRIVGNDIDNAGYQDWDLWPDYDVNLTGELRVRRDSYVALAPRFDDTHFRSPGKAFDQNLSLGWYQRQWQWILEHRNQVGIIAIYSWNEFHERSHIEPAYDATADVEPFYLYDLTKAYIKAFREPRDTACKPEVQGATRSYTTIPEPGAIVNTAIPNTYINGTPEGRVLRIPLSKLTILGLLLTLLLALVFCMIKSLRGGSEGAP